MKKAVPFIIFGIIAALLLSASAVAGIGLANRTFTAEIAPQNASVDFVGIVDSLDEKNQEYYNEIHVMSDLHELVSSWAKNNNDAKMHLENVTSFLLVIKEAGTVTTNYGSADIISLVSVNKDAKQINVVALDTDSLVFVDLAETSLKADGPVYAKLNTAYANGGIDLLKKTIEKNFKISVDHYLVSDMAGIELVVKALGGISVMLDKELKDMITDDFNLIMPGDNNPLNGQQMVGYLREKRDGAEQRLERLCEALTSAITSAQNMSFTEALDFVKVLSDNAKTDLSGMNLVKVLFATLLGGWNDYKIVSSVCPDVENAVSFKDSSWIRVIDIPVEAKAMQEKLFNKSNITLNDSRISSVELINAINKVFFNDTVAPEQNVQQPENPEETTGEGEENTEDTTAENEDSGSLG